MKHARGKRCGRVSTIDRAIAWLRLDRGGCGPTAIRLSWTAQVVSPALSVARSRVVRGAGHKQVLGEGVRDLDVGPCAARESARLRARRCCTWGGSRACSAQVGRQSLLTRAFMIPDTMLMTMDATNALPNVAMSMPTWKIPLASHAATYSMSVFTTR